jgi:L-threonylcarbamoyladenylate synthase
MSIECVSESTIQTAASLLRDGRLVAFPTETVYGLGADATNDSAVQAIFEAKGRPSNNPLIIHVASVEQLFECIDPSQCSQQVLSYLTLLTPLWPGPLSVVLPRAQSISDIVSAGGTSVAVRIPANPVALQLLREFGRPLAAPSANVSNYVSPTTAEHVASGLGDKVELIIDGGTCTVGIESTVLSLLNDKPTILRPGSITQEQLEAMLHCSIPVVKHIESASAPIPSPGLLLKHYAPRTPVKLLSSVDEQSLTQYQRIGVILFDKKSSVPEHACVVSYASTSGNPEEVAANLFSQLRALDEQKLDVIAVDSCESSGIGLAIMDRLARATHS